MDEVRHVSVFAPGTAPERPPLVLLHGTGGRETDLMPFAEEIAPGSARLGIRGTVEIAGGYAFFQRYPDRRVNEADLTQRVPALAGSISALLEQNHMHRRPIAVGFSNGAIAAAAVLHTVPGLFAGAVLLRSLPPFETGPQKRLGNTPVLIIDAQHDERRLPHDGHRAAQQLRRAGAQVTRHVAPSGHALTGEDAEITRRWLESVR
jgi:phospholipase/carboxylesterase